MGSRNHPFGNDTLAVPAFLVTDWNAPDCVQWRRDHPTWFIAGTWTPAPKKRTRVLGTDRWGNPSVAHTPGPVEPTPDYMRLAGPIAVPDLSGSPVAEFMALRAAAGQDVAEVARGDALAADDGMAALGAQVQARSPSEVSQTAGAAAAPAGGQDAASIKPLDVGRRAVAFVGGAGDQSVGSLMIARFNEYHRKHNDSAYFTWDDAAGLDAWIRARNGDVVVIAHSYGADTAATVIAHGAKVATLVTLDPVSQFRPDMAAVQSNTGEWRNYEAVGGGATFNNFIAFVGGRWGTAPRGYATTFSAIDVDHAGIAGRDVVRSLLPDLGN